MGVDSHEYKRFWGQLDPNPACKRVAPDGRKQTPRGARITDWRIRQAETRKQITAKISKITEEKEWLEVHDGSIRW